jgi:hypothetical protein
MIDTKLLVKIRVKTECSKLLKCYPKTYKHKNTKAEVVA